MKKANKDKRVEYGRKLCEERIEKLNNLLNNNLLSVKVKDRMNNVIGEEFILNGDSKIVINKVNEVVAKIKEQESNKK